AAGSRRIRRPCRRTEWWLLVWPFSWLLVWNCADVNLPRGCFAASATDEPPACRGSLSCRCSSAATEEFFVSANHLQRRCVAHFDADRPSDLPADIAQQRSFGCCRDRSRPAVGIQQVLR